MTDPRIMEGWPDGLPEPSVLFCTSVRPEDRRRPLFSRREVIAGPACEDAAEDGGVRALKTPAGVYDIADLLARLPAHQRPDLIVVQADGRDGGVLPRGLGRFRGARVLLAADSVAVGSLRTLLRYAESEPFDLVVVGGSRSHGGFFRDAGFERVCWIPALDGVPYSHPLADGPEHGPVPQDRWRALRHFYAVLFDGRVDPAIALDGSVPGRTREAVERRLDAYEAVCALSVSPGESLTVLTDPADALGFAATVGTLPRTAVEGYPEDTDPPAGAKGRAVLALPWPEAAGAVEGGLLARFTGEWVVGSGREWRDRLDVVRLLEAWGFSAEGDVTFRLADPFRHAEKALARLPAGAGGWLLERLTPWLGVPDAALRAAALARKAGEAGWERTFLARAVALDRGHDGALLAFAKLAEMEGRFSDTYLAVAELARHRPPGTLDGILAALRPGAAEDSRIAEHGAALLPAVAAPASPRRRVLVVTNLFPPQEFGGYGRKLWEFSAELKRRGHDIRVLAADVPAFAKPGTVGTDDLEPVVDRSLELYGEWREGRAQVIGDMDRVTAIIRANDRRVRDAAERFGAEVCLAGNVDLMSPNPLAQLPQLGIPVLHCVGNRHPGYPAGGAPSSPLYRIGPASEWVGRTLREAGFSFPAMTVLYPGARIDRFYRPFPPARDRLRIVFASLLVNYKGPHVLANALTLLHRQGVDFSCVFAGDTPDPGLSAAIREHCARMGFADKVSYAGFLDRDGLARLFERSNVLVFPSSFDEPFGISQAEAMAAGLTVVSSGTGGSREIVRDGVDGLLFAVDDHGDLAAKLKGLADDPARWARLARSGQERALSFTVARTVDRIEATFEELLRMTSSR